MGAVPQEVIPAVESLDWHVDRIAESWRSSVEGIFETGRRVQAALDQLPHGEKSKLWDRLPFGKATGSRLITVADQSDRFVSYTKLLPPAWGTLYELTQLDNDELPVFMESGVPIEQKRIRDWRKEQTGTRGANSANQAIITNVDPDVRAGDFREVLSDIEPGSVKLILTDPPYPVEYIDLWSDLAEFAADKLTDDGMLIAYSGKYAMPEVLNRLSEHLQYWWMSSIHLTGSGHSTPLGNPVRKIVSQWRPLLMFVRNRFEGVIHDVVPGGQKNKDDHNWAQAISESAWMIERYTSSGDLVVDPMAGSGTVAKACRELGRQFIGAEINATGE